TEERRMDRSTAPTGSWVAGTESYEHTFTVKILIIDFQHRVHEGFYVSGDVFLCMASHTSEVSDLVARHPSPSQSKEKLESAHANPRDSSIVSQTNKVQWGIDWRVPTTMAGLLVAGVLLATVHHILYLALDGEMARSGENLWDI
ncbi:MAG: hypothetical protein Q9205_005905, partial [Flavoplaca limonia]